MFSFKKAAAQQPKGERHFVGVGYENVVSYTGKDGSQKEMKAINIRFDKNIDLSILGQALAEGKIQFMGLAPNNQREGFNDAPWRLSIVLKPNESGNDQ